MSDHPHPIALRPSHRGLPVLFTVAVMALAVSLEPYRIGMTVVMLGRPRPLLQLLAFLSGGLLMGLTVGLVILFVVRGRIPDASNRFGGRFAEWIADYFTLGNVQLLLGSALLAVAAVLAVKDVQTVRAAVERLGPRASRGLSERASSLAVLATRTRRWLTRDSLWIAGGTGLGIGLPSVDYLAVLAVILASEAAALIQIEALVLYHVIAFGLIELPLLAYAFAPEATRAAMARVNGWIQSRRRAQVITTLGVLGAILVVLGLTAG